MIIGNIREQTMCELAIGAVIGIIFSAVLFTILAIINDEYIIVIVQRLIACTIFIFIFLILLGVQHELCK